MGLRAVRESWTQLRIWATFGNLDWLSPAPARLLSNQGSTVLCKSLVGCIKQDTAVSQGLCSRASPINVYVPLFMGQVWAVFLLYTCELHICSYLGSIFHIPWPEESIAGVSVCFSATYIAFCVTMVAYIHIHGLSGKADPPYTLPQEELENFPLPTVQHSQTVLNQLRYPSVLLLVCQDSDQNKPDIHFFHCDEVEVRQTARDGHDASWPS